MLTSIGTVAHLIAARVVESLLTALVVSLVVFALLEMSPGDPATKLLSATGVEVFDERALQIRRHELGLDRSAPERYVTWLRSVAQLDLGQSYVNRKPVVELIRQKIVPSLTLAGATVVASMIVAIPLGVLAATRANSALDGTVRVVALLGASFPGFWIALAAMWLFAAQLHWLPALGGFSLRGLVLPVLVLSIRSGAFLVRVTRAAMLEVLHSDYVTVARAKGLSPMRVIWGHAFPNAAIPVLTVLGLDFSGLFAQAVVIEWVFAWPGIGRMGVDAALAHDTPVLLGFMLVACLLVVVVNLAVVVAYGILDPRLRDRR